MLRSLFLSILMICPFVCQGEAQWSEPQVIANSPDVYQVSAAANGKDSAVIVYTHVDDENSKMWIEGTLRELGAWGTPTQISQKMNNGSLDPKVVLDPDGFAYALWRYYDGGMEGLNSVYHVPGFTHWIDSGNNFPCMLATSIDQFEIAFGGSGGEMFVTAVWSGELNGSFFIQAAQFNRSSHRWTAIAPIPLDGKCKSFDVKVDSQGLTWLTWTLFSYSDHKDDVYITSLLADATQWAPSQLLSKGLTVGDLKLAIDAKDNVLVRWILNGQGYLLQAFKKEADSIAWLSTTFPKLKNEWWPITQVTIDRKGNIMLIWDQKTELINSMVLSADSLTWSKPAPVSNGFSIAWETAIDKAGNRLFVSNNMNGYLQAETLARSSTTWSPPFQIAPLQYSNSNIFNVSLSKGRAIIIYEDDQTVKVIEGTSLFN